MKHQTEMYVLEEGLKLVGVMTNIEEAKKWFYESPITRNFCTVPLMDKTFSQMVTQNTSYEG